MNQKIFVLGGCRSGKSKRAEALAREWGKAEKIYMATYQSALNEDEEMLERVKRHQERRGPEWQTIEVAGNLPESLGQQSGQGKPVLLDCVTMWLSSLMDESAESIEKRIEELEKVLEQYQGDLIVVGNEVGQGLVPPDKIARLFRDMNGFLNQAVARAVDRVELITAGLPMILKEKR
jgi:adenosylcobinamide kinase/adenosylcobinamide-phosphate guanylyltransferase